MATELIRKNDKAATIRHTFEKMKGQMAMALPKHLNPDRMLRIAMTSIQRTPQLMNCTTQSLVAAVMQAAQLGLEPDGLLGHAYLVPYGQTCTLIPGYKGLLKLARNSGEISTVQAHAVHERDLFEFEYGFRPNLRHVPSWDSDPGAVVAFYAVATLKDGAVQFEVMSKTEVERCRARSMAAKSTHSPWTTDYEEMGKKTVLRRLCKMLPSSVDLATAVALDERAEVGLPAMSDEIVDISTPVAELEEPKPKSKLDAVVDKAAKAKLEAPKPEAPEPDTDNTQTLTDEQWDALAKGLDPITGEVIA